ncbi:MAG: hypothetical protein V4736_03185 [Bdellovibrionota bacterium]
MRTQVISAAHIWQRPCDLLFMQWNSLSPLQRQIDWYLNFGISNSLRHVTKNLTEPQKDFVTEVGLKATGELADSGLMLYLSPPHFMARYVVAGLDSRVSLEEAFLKAANWLKVGRASILLPTSVPVEEFKTTLQKLGFEREIFIAMDVAPLVE